jgi:endonuclease/exonuclease/phosphatase family metal-dependent hydrolase
MKLSILSQNIRCRDDANGHSVAERAPRLYQRIHACDPDLIGLQEASKKWENFLEPLKEEYGVIWMYRQPIESLEATPLYWKKALFELVEEEHFWLSETPQVPTKGWNADCYRICSHATLRHKESGKLIHFYNTHFDWVGKGPRESAQLIIRKAEKHGDLPVFCTADYNFIPESAPWHSMRSWFYDARETLCPENITSTCVGYNPPVENIRRIIDMCFYHGSGVTPTEYRVLTETYDEKHVSDHFGVYFEFEVK